MLFVGKSNGTTVVIVRTDKFLLIGVDSHVATMNPDTGTSGFAGCKIIKSGQFFIVVTGIFGEGGPKGLNAYALAQDISHQEKSAASVADRFEKLALKPYSKMLRRFHKKNPTVFDRSCNNKECLQLLIAEYAGGIPVYALRRFQVTLWKGTPQVKRLPNLDCPGTCPVGNSAIIIGDNIEANALNQSPDFWKEHSVLSGIEELIKAEASSHSDEVGGPIAILGLDKDGPQVDAGVSRLLSRFQVR
jgi:hypothetical protein